MSAFRQVHVSNVARWLGYLVTALAVIGAAHAQADDPPGRVGRLADVHGRVWVFDAEQGQWVDAQRNRALTSGDRLSTDRDARAAVRVGSTDLRLAGGTEVELARIDDERMVFQLHSGSLALRVRSSQIAGEVEVRTGEGRLLPERSGHYRVDRKDDTTFAVAWRGSMRFEAPDMQVQVRAVRRAEFFQQPGSGTTVVAWSAPQNDAFSDWVARDEQRDDRSVAQRYVSPEMTGAEDLDRYGRWDSHPEFGMVWAPTQVVVGWAPYRHGRWGWQARWGWTWIDDAPWGFAPFHYGRWVNWGGRWCWTPGAYVARPVFAPALVAWVGGPHLRVSINVGGGPAVGWVPLAPRDVYVPAFRYGPNYFQRVNRPQHPHRVPQVPTGPVMYGNHGVPGAVTVVPSNVLAQRQPVAAAALRDAEVPRVFGAGRFRHETPAAPPTRVVAVPGGALPAGGPRAPGREARPPNRVADLRHGRAVPVAQPAAPAAAGAAKDRAPKAGPEAPPRGPGPVAAQAARDTRERPPREGQRAEAPESRQRTPEPRMPQRERQNTM